MTTPENAGAAEKANLRCAASLLLWSGVWAMGLRFLCPHSEKGAIGALSFAFYGCLLCAEALGKLFDLMGQYEIT